MKAIYRYWHSKDSIIFGDYKDALFGFVVLVLLPCLSLFSIWQTSGFVRELDNRGTVFWSYSFPLISISISGLFDAITRYEHNSQKNPKLVVRIVIDGLAALLASVMGGQEKTFLRLIPALLLSISGLLLLREIAVNVITSIKLSPWAAKEQKD